ncbi:unnamed protein product [Camellia sinensis]
MNYVSTFLGDNFSYYVLENLRFFLPNSCSILAFFNHMRCPFCKTMNYAVEYRGVKTKEEKGIEQIVRFSLP